MALLSPLVAVGGRHAVVHWATGWTTFHRLCTRWILGIRVKVEGTRPTTPALYPAKHQAMFETMELQRILDGPAMVLKRELANIPVWGWTVRKYGAIVVDRSASAKAMRGMMRDAKVAVEQGRAIMIFPEGTRVKPGETPPLKPGFAGLYRMLNLPVVPVATDSGIVWPRKGLKRPGVVTLRFGEVIPPGLPRAEAEARVHAAMNALESSPARGGVRA
ncbi:1-acyl-sn-glycerol-3-phosphate acyltransferase [Sphingomonas sp. Sph1(2015)]|nr:1-acyl-sn-glycerol-3-phosphate acyltransferase [Sphingomonas sp. Sph1(2015)]